MYIYRFTKYECVYRMCIYRMCIVFDLCIYTVITHVCIFVLLVVEQQIGRPADCMDCQNMCTFIVQCMNFYCIIYTGKNKSRNI